MARVNDETRLKTAYFRKSVIEFYLKAGRRFPWRETGDPYVVLASELLLQKTTSEQVLKVFSEFFTRFPNINALARADVSEIESIIGSLGLRKRARFLKNLALQIVEEYNGVVPKDRETLLRLKGVGLYTANAVLAFAYNKCTAVVDTNVARVIRRYFCLKGDKPAYADKSLWELAEQLVPSDKCKEYNYGILDLAALICRPRSPLCNKCPLAEHCCYYRSRTYKRTREKITSGG